MRDTFLGWIPKISRTDSGKPSQSHWRLPCVAFNNPELRGSISKEPHK